MFSWKLILNALLGGFVGRLLAVAFIAVCVVLGFGPEQWAEWFVGNLLTPDVARVGFIALGLLVISLLILSFFWKPTVHEVPPEPVADDGKQALEKPAQKSLANVPIHIQRANLRAALKGGVTFTGSHNVSSIIDVGSGDYIVNFVAPFDGDYGVIPIAGNTDKYRIEARTPSSVRLVFPDGDPERMDFRFEADSAPQFHDADGGKVAAIDEALELLGHERHMMRASAELREARAIWEQAVDSGDNEAYVARMRKAAADMSSLIGQVRSVAQRHAKFADLRAVLDRATDGVDLGLIHQMIDDFKRIPPNADQPIKYFFGRIADAARPTINLIDSRRKEAEDGLIAMRQALTS